MCVPAWSKTNIKALYFVEMSRKCGGTCFE